MKSIEKEGLTPENRKQVMQVIKDLKKLSKQKNFGRQTGAAKAAERALPAFEELKAMADLVAK